MSSLPHFRSIFSGTVGGVAEETVTSAIDKGIRRHLAAVAAIPAAADLISDGTIALFRNEIAAASPKSTAATALDATAAVTLLLPWRLLCHSSSISTCTWVTISRQSTHLVTHGFQLCNISSPVLQLFTAALSPPPLYQYSVFATSAACRHNNHCSFQPSRHDHSCRSCVHLWLCECNAAAAADAAATDTGAATPDAHRTIVVISCCCRYVTTHSSLEHLVLLALVVPEP